MADLETVCGELDQLKQKIAANANLSASAATAAIGELVQNWKAALGDGNKLSDMIAVDVAHTIGYLNEFAVSVLRIDGFGEVVAQSKNEVAPKA
jgi:hypothetical protein